MLIGLAELLVYRDVCPNMGKDMTGNNLLFPARTFFQALDFCINVKSS